MTVTAKYTDGGLYTASKTAHAPKWRALQEHGVRICSTWIHEAGKGETADFGDLWCRCVQESSGCTALLCYREPGEVLKGAFVEVGAALASDRLVMLVGDWDGFSFVHHPNAVLRDSVEHALYSMRPSAIVPTHWKWPEQLESF